MARIVALSSLVAYGHVGLRAMVPALERQGHDVIAVPTVVLSSHAAYPHVAGTSIDPATLETIANALDDNGWLSSVEMVITGYLPTPAHVTVASDLVQRIRRQSPAMIYVCDPVLGDDPKGLYLPVATANALRDDLLPLAGITTPNAFELAWLSDRPVTSIETAVTAARSFGHAMVLATSIPAPDHRLATLLVNTEGAKFTSVPCRPKAPSGTGDLLTALFAGSCAGGDLGFSALAGASAWLEQCLAASTAGGDLCLSPLYGAAPTPFELFAA